VVNHSHLVLIFTLLSKRAEGCDLMPNRLIILSEHTLFAEGVASRLRQYPERVDVRFVDPQQPDYLDQIKKIRPSAVIINAAETDGTQCCLLCDLLIALANVTIVRLEIQDKDIQIVRSWQHSLTEVKDILKIIEQSPQQPGQ
jgi:DNA-binding NarL/FixJ family response regulator